MLGVTTHPASREETAVLHTLPRPCSRLQTMPGTGDVLPAACPVPDPAVFREAVARWRALRALEEFRLRLYGCFTARADALFELADGAPRGAVVPDGGERPSISPPS